MKIVIKVANSEDSLYEISVLLSEEKKIEKKKRYPTKSSASSTISIVLVKKKRLIRSGDLPPFFKGRKLLQGGIFLPTV